jgi:hypothetical protein
MATKYAKWQQNIPNDNKIYQMAIKHIHISTSSIARPSKIYPNGVFLVGKYAIWQPWLRTRWGARTCVTAKNNLTLTPTLARQVDSSLHPYAKT